MSAAPRLSASIITLNEELDLPGCLASLEPLKSLGLEIVVVDNHSADKTRELAAAAGAKVLTRRFDDYASQKQHAVAACGGDWVLSLDADERLSPELAAEIAETLAAEPPADCYELPFEVHFLGKRLRFGGLGGERHLRLFRRGKGRFVGGALHEGIACASTPARMRARVVHIPYRDVDDYLGKLAVYTSNAARKRRDAGKRWTPLYHLLPFWVLFERLVLKLGLLDGTPGIVWAGLSACHSWLKYVKLRQLERVR